MTKKPQLGDIIKNFRKAKGLSQLQLENEIDASQGSISRIENNQVSPTRKTILKIATILKLNKFEIDYLIGTTTESASQEEINTVINEYKDYFSKKGIFAYILDERNRLIYSSRDFQNLLGLTGEKSQNLHGMMLTEIMLYPELGINALIKTENYEDLLHQTFSRLYYENYFMSGDPYYEKAVRAIYSNPTANKIWESIQKEKPKTVNIFGKREVTFKVYGMDVKMTYSSEVIYSNSRFMLVEYTPTNLIMRLLSKLK